MPANARVFEHQLSAFRAANMSFWGGHHFTALRSARPIESNFAPPAQEARNHKGSYKRSEAWIGRLLDDTQGKNCGTASKKEQDHSEYFHCPVWPLTVDEAKLTICA